MTRLQAGTAILGLVLTLTLSGCDSKPSGGTSTAAPTTGTTPAAPAEPKAVPKAVVPEVEFNFGVTEVGEEFTHVFIIKNEGNATLELHKGTPSCSTCTSFEVDHEFLQPGETAKATVKWKIQAKNPEFRQHAPINTNDPLYGQIKLYVVGKVENRVNLEPSGRWDFGELKEGEVKKFQATLTSPTYEDLKVASIGNENKFITVTPVAMTEEELKERKLKSGYFLNVEVSPDIPVGDLKSKIVVNVLTPKQVTLPVDVEAQRPGPLTILGPNWHADRMMLNLGNFPKDKGITVKLQLYTRGVEGELKFENVETNEHNLKVELTPDTKFVGKTKRYEAKFTMAPSSKPSVHSNQNPLHVKVQTNQPRVGEIVFKIVSRGT